MDKEALFSRLVKLLSVYAPKMDVRHNNERAYDLYGTKPVEINNKVQDGIYFASAIIRANYVGFYFFPIYTHPDEYADIPPEIRKCLKGKSCFYIKKDDDQLFGQVEAMLAQGFKHYQSIGWA